jgi:hypothetical protein
MMLAGKEDMILAAYVLGSDDFRLFDVEANATLQERIYGRCERFIGYLRKQEPPFDLALDPAQVASYYKPIEGETFEADTLLGSLIVERQRLSASKAEASKQLDEVNTEIRAILMGRTALFGDGSTMSLVSRQRKGYTVKASEYTQLIYMEATSNGNGRD